MTNYARDPVYFYTFKSPLSKTFAIVHAINSMHSRCRIRIYYCFDLSVGTYCNPEEYVKHGYYVFKTSTFIEFEAFDENCKVFAKQSQLRACVLSWSLQKSIANFVWPRFTFKNQIALWWKLFYYVFYNFFWHF